MKAVDSVLRTVGSARIERIAAQAGLSARQLRRRFREATGLSPKELALLRRARAVIVDAATAPSTDWCDLAVLRGYSDQSHLVRELRRTLGSTPADHMRDARRIKHIRVRR
jgi:AraC-like DNA-binding protein